MINALGEKHGTITARINDAVNFEVTTLRIDKVGTFLEVLLLSISVFICLRNVFIVDISR